MRSAGFLAAETSCSVPTHIVATAANPGKILNYQHRGGPAKLGTVPQGADERSDAEAKQSAAAIRSSAHLVLPLAVNESIAAIREGRNRVRHCLLSEVSVHTVSRTVKHGDSSLLNWVRRLANSSIRLSKVIMTVTTGARNDLQKAIDKEPT